MESVKLSVLVGTVIAFVVKTKGNFVVFIYQIVNLFYSLAYG